MTKNFGRFLPLVALAAMVTWYGCKKETPLTIPAAQAHFTNKASGSYFITAPGVTFKVPVGVTTVANVDRTVVVSVSSPTGAVQGTHYTLDKTSVVIPAGKAIDSITVTGNFAQYSTGRRDTLVFRIEGTDKGSSVAPTEYNNEYRLFMRGPCLEQEVATEVQAMQGTYAGTEFGYNATTGAEVYNAGAGTSNVTGAAYLSPTTAELTVNNIFRMGAAITAKINLDFSNIADRRVTVAEQRLGPGTLLNSAWTTWDAFIIPIGAVLPQPAHGTFTFCGNSVITFKYRIQLRDASTGAVIGNVSRSGGTVFMTRLVKQ